MCKQLWCTGFVNSWCVFNWFEVLKVVDNFLLMSVAGAAYPCNFSTDCNPANHHLGETQLSTYHNSKTNKRLSSLWTRRDPRLFGGLEIFGFVLMQLRTHLIFTYFIFTTETGSTEGISESTGNVRDSTCPLRWAHEEAIPYDKSWMCYQVEGTVPLVQRRIPSRVRGTTTAASK